MRYILLAVAAVVLIPGLRGHGSRDLTWRVQDGLVALASFVSTGR